MNGYQELGNAVIIQACKDYRKSIRILKKSPTNALAKSDCKSIEQFFHSALFDSLTNLDGNVLIEKLRREVK